MQYVRVKHGKTVLFVRTKPNESIYRVKLLIGNMIKKKDTRQIRLLQAVNKTYVPLENNANLDELGLVNDSLLFMVLQTEDGNWENLVIEEFEPLEDKN